jgi:hypothetical protein
MNHWTPYSRTCNSINLNSLNYRYSIASPKAFTGLFATHTTIRSEAPIRFTAGDWTKLSDSGKYHRWLATSAEGSTLVVIDADGDLIRRVVHVGAIVLTEHDADGAYVVHVPRFDPGVELSASDDGERVKDER